MNFFMIFPSFQIFLLKNDINQLWINKPEISGF